MTDERRTRLKVVRDNIGQPTVELSFAEAARAKLEEILVTYDPTALMLIWDNGENISWDSLPQSAGFITGCAFSLYNTLIDPPKPMEE